MLSGWRAPGWPAAWLARRLRTLVGDPDPSLTLTVPFTFIWRFEEGVRRVAEQVEHRWPDRDGGPEFDVVGISMGGLIARAAAAGLFTRPIPIARLFTLGTPHRGAKIARWVRPDPLVKQMRPGSQLLARLDEAAAAHELICYTRLRDSWVGATNTAPIGTEPIWTPGPLCLGHQTITTDSLIVTDIARRLREEPPLARAASRPPRD